MGYTSRIPLITAGLDEAIHEAIQQGADRVEAGAKERVPVDHGDLRDAIHTEKGGGGMYVIAGDNNAFYGHMVENGTVKQAPRPFLIPALEANRAGIVTEVGAAIKAIT